MIRDHCFPLAQQMTLLESKSQTRALHPIFRTRRDADITRGIYERHPVLVDRSQGRRASHLAECGTIPNVST